MEKKEFMSFGGRLAFLEHSIETMVGIMEISDKSMNLIETSHKKMVIVIQSMLKRLDKLEKAQEGTKHYVNYPIFGGPR